MPLQRPDFFEAATERGCLLFSLQTMAHIAIKTLAAFEQAVHHDQGNTWRGWLARVMPHMHDAYRTDESVFRSHMGASGIGKDCARAIWYDFRWATRKLYDGRMLRLFNRGHMEEGRFIALLLSIGCQVYQQDANGKQYRISELGGHYGGSGDGIATGIPDLPPGTAALSEFKTHNDKSFKKLAGTNWEECLQSLLNPDLPKVKFTGVGVREAKPEHYVQMQQYMDKMGLAVGVYFAVNKDNDFIYAEVVPLDKESAARYTDRAVQLVLSKQPPKRINESPSWHVCKFCDHAPVCHFGRPIERNCRTCEFADPRPDGTWWCASKDRQLAMLFGPKKGVSDPGETYQLNKSRQLAGCTYWLRNSKA